MSDTLSVHTAQKSESPHLSDLAKAVLSGLGASRKTLPSRFFYDSKGSDLFELITALPEYYPTRTERLILETHIESIVAAAEKSCQTMVEFGSGSSYKTRLIIEAILRKEGRLSYAPIDISAAFLAATAQTLEAEYPNLTVQPLAAEYFAAMDQLHQIQGPRLFLFLGSNIGNFDPDEAIRFLKSLRRNMSEGDQLLIGIDLVKDQAILEAAYNDEQGVTEAFNKNVLARINAELGANFDLDAFSHLAPWVEPHHRIEMHLESRWRQEVTIEALGQTFTFESGETIHTENSHKYTLRSFEAIAGHACMEPAEIWTDPQDWFALTLLNPI